MSRSPKGIYHREGWRAISCLAADVLRSGLKPASSLTNETIVFTEWWTDEDYPAMREYRYPGSDEPCEHYVVDSDRAWIEDEE